MRRLLSIRFVLILLALSFSLSPYAQKKTQRKTNTTAQKRTSAATRQKTTSRQKSGAQKRKKNAAPTKAERKAATYSNASIRGLQGQRASIQRKIREQEKALQKNKEDVKKRLQDLMVINGEIDQRQKNIEGIQKDIHHIEGNIGILNAQLKTLEQQLQDRKNKYIRSMRYMSRHHSVQEKLIFIFIFSVLACGPVQRIAMEKLPNLEKKWKYSWIEIGLGVLVFLLAISTLASNTYNPFIYFRF